MQSRLNIQPSTVSADLLPTCKSGTILTTVTKMVDTVALTDSTGYRYEIGLEELTNFKYSTLIIYVSRFDSNDVKHAIQHVGNILNVGISIGVVSSNIEFEITNNESETVGYKLRRFKI